MTASRYCASSSSRKGKGSPSGPWPGPVFSIFLGSAPTKLYLPIVSELAALSNRKEYLALDLAEILRYASVGVNISAGMVAHNGTRFGGFEEFLDAESISCTVSNDGCMFS